MTASTDERPNVLLIHCHDLGQYLGCYGRDIDTPNIDAIANEGVRFENHYATAPQCSPSRGSLITGNYPTTHGLIGLAHGHWELDDDQTTLPQYLTDRGYRTHLFGLQHVSERPERLGFGTIHSDRTLSPDTDPSVHQTHRARGVADDVAAFLDDRSVDQPFFASVGFFELHRMNEEGSFGFEDPAYEGDDPDEIEPLPYLPDEPGIREDLAAMHGMVRAIDEAVGTITDALAAAGLDDETLVIFTTEHGIAFPRAKGCCYDPGIEAALLVRYPELFEAGATYDDLVSNVDVLPTILDLVGGDVPAVDGRSVLPLLTDGEYQPREELFSGITWHDGYTPSRSIRTPRYKYIRNFWWSPRYYLTRDVFVSKAGREVREDVYSGYRPYEELYDLEADPLETNNRADDPGYDAVRTRLRERLVDWMRETDDPLIDGPVPPADYDEIVPPEFRAE